MEITRIFTGADNKSHFAHEQLTMNDSEFGNITDLIKTENLFFGEIIDLVEIPWHNPSCRQYVIMLEGAVEVEIGDGTKKIFNPGDILLAEDIHGQGHITRPVTKGKLRYMVIITAS